MQRERERGKTSLSWKDGWMNEEVCFRVKVILLKLAGRESCLFYHQAISQSESILNIFSLKRKRKKKAPASRIA